MDLIVQLVLFLLDPFLLIATGLFRWVNAPFNLPDKIAFDLEESDPMPEKANVIQRRTLRLLCLFNVLMILYCIFG